MIGKQIFLHDPCVQSVGVAVKAKQARPIYHLHGSIEYEISSVSLISFKAKTTGAKGDNKLTNIHACFHTPTHPYSFIGYFQFSSLGAFRSLYPCFLMLV